MRPRGVYAQSKLLGEIFAREAPRHYVLRVASLFGASNGKSSVDKLALAIRRGDRVRAFADRTVTPSYVYDVAEATVALLERDGAVRAVPLREQRRDDLGRGGADAGAAARRRSRPAPSSPCRLPAWSRRRRGRSIPTLSNAKPGRGRRRAAAVAGRARSARWRGCRRPAARSYGVKLVTASITRS